MSPHLPRPLVVIVVVVGESMALLLLQRRSNWLISIYRCSSTQEEEEELHNTIEMMPLSLFITFSLHFISVYPSRLSYLMFISELLKPTQWLRKQGINLTRERKIFIKYITIISCSFIHSFISLMMMSCVKFRWVRRVFLHILPRLLVMKRPQYYLERQVWISPHFFRVSPVTKQWWEISGQKCFITHGKNREKWVQVHENPLKTI